MDPNHPLRDQLAQLAEQEQALRAQIQDATLLESMLTMLAERRAILQAKLSGSGTLIQGNHNAAAGAGGAVVQGDVGEDLNLVNIHNNLFVFKGPIAAGELLRALSLDKQPAADLEQAARDYLAGLVERYRYLDFRGMGISDRVPLKLPLLQMYVPLQARQEMPDGDTWDRVQLRLAGRAPGEAEQEAIGRRVGAPRPLLELLKENDGLICLGDPGSGKTTFLKYLALTLATGQGDRLGLPTRLPVLVPLSGYANALAADPSLPLERFIVEFHAARDSGLPMGELLHDTLERGGVLLLLDGLDEVKELAQRHQVVERVTDFFTTQRKKGNRFVITSRVVGYAEVRPRREGLAECTLVDFDEGEITLFVDQWTIALEQAARGQTGLALQEAEREKAELLDAVERNPGVRALAANPLLLTILALMKRQGVTLPERRVELYEKYVETLLYHWNLARGLGLGGACGRGLDPRETLKVLAPLALWMHRTSPGVGLVRETGLRGELVRIHAGRGAADPEGEAERFLDDVRTHTGLLLDRGARQYGFIHLTFQEYLAGVALAQKGQVGIEPIRAELAAHLGEDPWHEVSLLCIGDLALCQRRDEAAGALLEALIAADETGEAAILAGEAVVDVGPAGLPSGVRTRIALALLKTLRDDRRVTVPRRARAGRVLAEVGDPRPEVLEVDRMEFCRVPAGPFLMGSREGEGAADERPQHRVELPGYLIGRYPVTVAQFRRFCDEAGFVPGDRDSLRDPANHPVRWVSWHEALAFCDWLTERWRGLGWLAEGQRVTLPSEAEWEKAARGGLEIPAMPESAALDGWATSERTVMIANPEPGREYPWGKGWDVNRANGAETDVDEPSALASFPGGASPLGCEEMSGNLWEWTRSRAAGYPYSGEGKEREERESLTTVREDRRVLRGGAFLSFPDFLRCAFRLHDRPGFRVNGVGFRVVVSPYSDL